MKESMKQQELLKTNGPVSRVAVIALLVSLVWSSVGCGSSDRLPVIPVKGTVVYKGKPLSNAFVTFHPLNKQDPRLRAISATTNNSGAFELTTYNSHDGAPEGEYAVTVARFEVKGGNGSWEPGPNVLPSKYASPSTTDLKFAINRNDASDKRIEIR